MLKERKLKVYSQTRTSNSPGYFSPTKYSEVPAILLSGKWLEAAGFSIADRIKVSVENGKLVITKAEKEVELL